MIGLSLNLGFLTGNPVTNGEKTVLGRHSNLKRVLREFSGLGITHIEIHDVYPTTSPGLVCSAAEAIWASGLGLSVHGKLCRTDGARSFCEIYPSIQEILNRLKASGNNLVLVVHACSAASGIRQELADMTADILRQWTILIEQDCLPIFPAVELNRVKNMIDPSTNCEDILKIIDGIEGRKPGICWDMGHYYFNCLNNDTQELPPVSFISNTIHTHIHGVDKGKTHNAISSLEHLPFERYAGILKKAGYNGIYNLELDFNKLVNYTELVRSIDRLKKCLE